jgi:hypothetical protein
LKFLFYFIFIFALKDGCSKRKVAYLAPSLCILLVAQACTWWLPFQSKGLLIFIHFNISIIHIYNLINRFYIILKPMNIRKITIQISLIVVLFCVLNGLFWAMLPLFGWSRYTLEGALTSCSVEWKERSANVISYNITIFVLVYFIPILCILSTSIKLLLIVVSDWVLFYFNSSNVLIFIRKKTSEIHLWKTPN